MGTQEQDNLRKVRTKKLNAEVKILIDWLNLRLHSDCDELTTLTMLQRKVERIKGRVQQAGYEYLINRTKDL